MASEPHLGAYRGKAGASVAVLEASGLAPFLVVPSGATHEIAASLTVGQRFGDKSGNGSIAVDTTGFTWHATHYTRIALRQRELRVGVDAATLTLPLGTGRFPAAAMVLGSGASTSDEFDVFTAYLALNGIAVLADDKRGVGESGGTYPGDQARSATINVLAHDAQTEVRFLAKLPQVDPARVGLFGDSQARLDHPARRSARARRALGVTQLRTDRNRWRDRLLGATRRPIGATSKRHTRGHARASAPGRTVRLRPTTILAPTGYPRSLDVRLRRPQRPH
jgi:hypothetical protein